ncbi:MAG: HD domain-containing protein [Candidatus Colwellbacteria bacterium]|nr:HD domain-containing protein [Candidatus Colwellbacteria bacterium]
MDKIISLFRKRGGSDYIGEPVTQEQHMVGAALIAEEKGYSDDLIVAALLHDIGHLLFENEKMGDLGVKGHEKIGADYLRGLGFNETVCDLVENHVNAKRYLCTVSPLYSKNLSNASRKTLNYQGGPMSNKEIWEFRKRPRFEMYIDLRIVDELSKESDMKGRDLEYFIPLCERCMKNKIRAIYPGNNSWERVQIDTEPTVDKFRGSHSIQ